MLKWEGFDSIQLYRGFVDFRKSINGLSAIVESEGQELFSKSLFVFTNRSRDRLKLLYWDRTGFALWLKRLEQDKFSWPKHLSESIIYLNTEQLYWLLDGYAFWKLKPHETLNYRHVS